MPLGVRARTIPARATASCSPTPRPYCAREAFAAKPRALTDKLTTVADAVARLLHDDDYLAIGGFGADRLPLRWSTKFSASAGKT